MPTDAFCRVPSMVKSDVEADTTASARLLLGLAAGSYGCRGRHKARRCEQLACAAPLTLSLDAAGHPGKRAGRVRDADEHQRSPLRADLSAECPAAGQAACRADGGPAARHVWGRRAFGLAPRVAARPAGPSRRPDCWAVPGPVGQAAAASEQQLAFLAW